MKLPEKPSAEAVRFYRDLHSCGMLEAKSALMKQWWIDMLNAIRNGYRHVVTVGPHGAARVEFDYESAFNALIDHESQQ